MHLFLIEVESGLALAAIYGLMSVSLTFTYRVTGVVQLAQGDIMMCGSFAGYYVGTHVHNFVLVLVSGAVVCGAIGWLVYDLIFRWLLTAGHLTPLVVGLALSTAIEEGLRISFFQGQPAAFPKLGWVTSLSESNIDILVIVIAILIGVGLEWLLRRTRAGRNLRAVADNVEMARVLGINANRTRRISFAAGALVAGIAGILLAVVYGSISFNSGTSIEFVAIAAVLLGGLGSVPGALVGALVIGLGQALVSTYVSSAYQTAFVFGIVLLTIVLRPSGIFGLREARA